MPRVHHNYAPAYARHLARWINRETGPIVVEVGILRGLGLAMWCELFPTGTVIGLDIDLSHFHENLPNLQSRGAFRHLYPELLHFDSYGPDTSALSALLGDRRIDVVIDDGPYTIEAISRTAQALRPLLADRFTYFVEDDPDSLRPLAETLRPPTCLNESGGLVVGYT